MHAGTWKPEDRQRPRVQRTAVRRDEPTKRHHEAAHVIEHENAPDSHDENDERAEPRGAVSTIDSAPPTTSGQGEIASLIASLETQSAHTDEDQRTSNVPRETVPISDEVPAMTYHGAMRAHARAYLTQLLVLTGGERQRAAQLAGVARTSFQALVKRYSVNVPMNPKARGRNWRRSG